MKNTYLGDRCIGTLYADYKPCPDEHKNARDQGRRPLIARCKASLAYVCGERPMSKFSAMFVAASKN